MTRPPEDGRVVRIEISPRTIAWILLTIAGIWLLRQLWEIVLLMVVVLVVVGTFNPLIEWQEKHGFRRVHSLLLLFVGLIVVAVLLVFITVPPLVDQLTQIVHAAPQHRQHLITLLETRSITQPLAHIVENSALDQMFNQIEAYLLGYSARAVKALGFIGTTFVLAFYLLADGKRTQGALYALVPRDYHMRLARIIHNLQTIVGGYMRGQLLTSVMIGVFTLLLLLICGVPNALSLALFASLTDIVPFIGGLLAAAPAILSALSRGVPVAVTVLVSMFLYMQFENRVLIPRVYGRTLRLTPISVFLALLAGGKLLGVMGALLALPIAAGLQMILEELRVEMPGDDSDDRPARAQDAKVEATYERMSAGSTAPEAGEIASKLAHDIRDAAAVRPNPRASGDTR